MSSSLFSPIGDTDANLSFPIRQDSTDLAPTSKAIGQQREKISNEQSSTKYLSFSSVVDITNPKMNVDKFVASQSRKNEIGKKLLDRGFKQVEGTDTYKDKHLTVHLTSGKQATKPHSLSPLTKAFAVSSAIGYCLLYLIAGLVLGAIFLCTGLTGIWASKSVRKVAKSFFGALVARAQFQTGTWCSSNRVNCVTLTDELNKKVTLGAQPSLYVEMNKHAKSGEKPKTHPDIVAAKHCAVFSVQDPWERRAHGIARPLNAKEWNVRGVDYIEMNVPDHSGMSCEQLESAAFVMRLFAEKTDDGNEQQQGIYVHCKAGQGRSAQIVAADNIMNDGMHWVDVSLTVQQKKNGTTLWKPEKTGALKPFQAHAEFREIELEAIPLLKNIFSDDDVKFLMDLIKLHKNDKHRMLIELKKIGEVHFESENQKTVYISFLKRVKEIYGRRVNGRQFYTNSVYEIRNEKGRISYHLHQKGKGAIWSGNESDFAIRESSTAILMTSFKLVEALENIGQPLSSGEGRFLLEHSKASFVHIEILKAFAQIFSNTPARKEVFANYLKQLEQIQGIKKINKPENSDQGSAKEYVISALESTKPRPPAQARPLEDFLNRTGYETSFNPEKPLYE